VKIVLLLPWLIIVFTLVAHSLSLVGNRNTLFYSLFKVSLHKLYAVSKQIGFSVANHCISDDCMYSIDMIKELLCVKCQQFKLSSSYFNRHDIDCMIDFLCTVEC